MDIDKNDSTSDRKRAELRSEKANLSAPFSIYSGLGKIGICLSGLYLLVLVILGLFAWDLLFKMKPNEFGDLMAGIFAPLAFLWLVLGYFQQGQELKASVRALRMQSEEMKNSVDQQQMLVAATREQIEQENEAARQRRQDLRSHERGTLVGSVYAAYARDRTSIAPRVRLENIGRGKVKVTEITGAWRGRIERIDNLPHHLMEPVWIDPDEIKNLKLPFPSDIERGDNDKLIGRITYSDHFGDTHQIWVAGSVERLDEPTYGNPWKKGDPLHYKVKDMSSMLADE